MQLRNCLNHMKGQKVNVNGKSYPINEEGKIDIVDEKAIAKLLQNEVWAKVSARNPVGAKPPQSPDKPDFSKMGKADLINYCKYKNVEFKSSMKKEELIELLEKE